MVETGVAGVPTDQIDQIRETTHNLIDKRTHIILAGSHHAHNCFFFEYTNDNKNEGNSGVYKVSMYDTYPS